MNVGIYSASLHVWEVVFIIQKYDKYIGWNLSINMYVGIYSASLHVWGLLGCRRGGRIGQPIRLLPFAHKHQHYHQYHHCNHQQNQNCNGNHDHDKKQKRKQKENSKIYVFLE